MTPGFFDAADGLKLYREWYPAKGAPRAVVVVTHGYGDHCGRYGELAHRLGEAGFHVMTFDYRGHGQAGGRRGHCDRFDEYLGDLAAACGHARETTGSTRPLVVVAHSHGALIALRAAIEPDRIPTGVQALVVSSPFLGLAMKVSPAKLWAGRVASRWAPRLTMGNGLRGAQVSHDPAVVAAYDADRHCHKVATARWFTESSAAQAHVCEGAQRVTLPTLWLVAGADLICDVGVTRTVYDRVGGDKHLRVYDGFFHEVFNEVERGRVFRDVEHWLSARFPAA